MAEQPVVGQGFLIIEALRSHSDTPHSVGLLWTSDQPVSETSTWQHTTPHKTQTSIFPAWFEPTISAGERLQTHGVDLSRSYASYYSSCAFLGYISLHSPIYILYCQNRVCFPLCTSFFHYTESPLKVFSETIWAISRVHFPFCF